MVADFSFAAATSGASSPSTDCLPFLPGAAAPFPPFRLRLFAEGLRQFYSWKQAYGILRKSQDVERRSS